MPAPKVVAHMTMSLDGYIATDTDAVGALFDWYDAGPVEVLSANPDITFHLDEAGAAMMRSLIGGAGALVTGRRLFDLTGGWGDRHPIGVPIVVVTHTPPSDADRWSRTSFVDGIVAAVERARSVAGDRDVVLSSPGVIGQALDLGLVDEIAVSLVPVLFGGGKAYFGGLTRAPLRLEDPEITPGTRATHLRHRVTR